MQTQQLDRTAQSAENDEVLRCRKADALLAQALALLDAQQRSYVLAVAMGRHLRTEPPEQINFALGLLKETMNGKGPLW